MNSPFIIQTQLLATKFFVPTASRTLVSRQRLTGLLNESLKHPLTLISAPAGFGKTTLLSTWAQMWTQTDAPLAVAWLSLDEEDNDPQLFWTYVLSALDQQQPERFSSLLKHLQSDAPPPLFYFLTAIINLMLDNPSHLVLILDDYHIITETQVHNGVSYLLDHMPPRLHFILASRTDPPLLLSHLRARGQLLEIRADQLRCTPEETRAFFQETMGTNIPYETVQEMTTRTEGWLVGLQLLALSLAGRADTNPADWLAEVTGDQRYILDYLTEEVLGQQSPEMQLFLLSTSILEQLTAPLCDAVMGQPGSRQMLQLLESANLFVVALDGHREWYRYHALFAEALGYRLQQTYPDLVPILHHRASLWYAQHDQTTAAIIHAFKAREWVLVADLIEHKSLAVNALTWGVSQHNLLLMRDWLGQIPVEVLRAHPRLCLVRIWMLMTITPDSVIYDWITTVETTLTSALAQPQPDRQTISITPLEQSGEDLYQDLNFQASANQQLQTTILYVPDEEQKEWENMLGEAITYRALLRALVGDGETALALYQQAIALISPENSGARAHLSVTRIWSYHSSALNDAETALKVGKEAWTSLQTCGNIDQAVSIMGVTALHMIGTGRLHEVYQSMQQAIQMGNTSETFVLPRVGWPMLLQAEILREWNQLDAALSAVQEAIQLCQQLEWTIGLLYVLHGYTVLLRVHLSRGDLEAAKAAFQQIEQLGTTINRSFAFCYRAFFTNADQVRLWLACGEMERATRWAEQLELAERPSSLFAQEREEVGCIRILLAKQQAQQALERLTPVLQRATAGQRWSHVIEIYLLQALAHQMLHQDAEALDALSKALHLAEPEGFIRIFVDEGTPMELLLSQFLQYKVTSPKKKNRRDRLASLPDDKAGAGELQQQQITAYVDKLLTAFPKTNRPQKRQPKRAGTLASAGSGSDQT